MRKLNNEITPAQKRVLTAIHNRFKTTGLPPTRKELADDLGQFPNNVQEILERLHRKGYIKLTMGIARGISLRRIEQKTGGR
jgi:repressor LexA